MDKAYAAKTLGKFDNLMADLPRPTLASFRPLRWTAPLLARR